MLAENKAFTLYRRSVQFAYSGVKKFLKPAVFHTVVEFRQFFRIRQNPGMQQKPHFSDQHGQNYQVMNSLIQKIFQSLQRRQLIFLAQSGC